MFICARTRTARDKKSPSVIARASSPIARSRARRTRARDRPRSTARSIPRASMGRRSRARIDACATRRARGRSPTPNARRDESVRARATHRGGHVVDERRVCYAVARERPAGNSLEKRGTRGLIGIGRLILEILVDQSRPGPRPRATRCVCPRAPSGISRRARARERCVRSRTPQRVLMRSRAATPSRTAVARRAVRA